MKITRLSNSDCSADALSDGVFTYRGFQTLVLLLDQCQTVVRVAAFLLVLQHFGLQLLHQLCLTLLSVLVFGNLAFVRSQIIMASVTFVAKLGTIENRAALVQLNTVKYKIKTSSITWVTINQEQRAKNSEQDCAEKLERSDCLADLHRQVAASPD